MTTNFNCCFFLQKPPHISTAVGRRAGHPLPLFVWYPTPPPLSFSPTRVRSNRPGATPLPSHWGGRVASDQGPPGRRERPRRAGRRGPCGHEVGPPQRRRRGAGPPVPQSVHGPRPRRAVRAGAPARLPPPSPGPLKTGACPSPLCHPDPKFGS